MARLISICANNGDKESFFALRDDGCVYRCTLSSVGPLWEKIENAPNTKESALSTSTNIGSTCATQIADDLEIWLQKCSGFTQDEIEDKINTVCNQLRTCQ